MIETYFIGGTWNGVIQFFKESMREYNVPVPPKSSSLLGEVGEFTIQRYIFKKVGFNHETQRDIYIAILEGYLHGY